MTLLASIPRCASVISEVFLDGISSTGVNVWLPVKLPSSDVVLSVDIVMLSCANTVPNAPSDMDIEASMLMDRTKLCLFIKNVI